MWVANILGGAVALLIGIVIRVFNASGLIAGYNTLPAEEQALYDERALTGFAGNLLIASSLVLIAGGLLPGAEGISWLLFVAIIIGGIVFMKTGERFKR